MSGWRRRFSLRRDNQRSEKTFALADGSIPDWILSLNVEPAEPGQAGPNGVLIEVSGTELKRLDGREIRYSRVEVGDAARAIPGAPSFDRVFAYTAKPENLAPDDLTGAVVLRSYLTAVEAAFEALGAEHLAAYATSTEPPPVEIVEAQLVHDRIPPGNPREW